MSGAGGSIAFADPEQGLVIAIILNKLMVGAPDSSRQQELCDTIRTALGVS